MTRSSRFPLSLLGVLSFLLHFACGGATLSGPGSVHPIPEGPGYLAGVAEADITPPLHLSLFGHGPEGRIATGVRLRLKCQVFVIALDPPKEIRARGTSAKATSVQDTSLGNRDVVALVPCELQSPSLELQRGVAAKLREVGIPITADRLFIMATHTHAGPAHYFQARRYSGPFSSQAPGYDHRVLDFLVKRIAAGIGEAYAALAPACLGWRQEQVRGLTFNRSYVPFLANERSSTQDIATTARQADQERQSQAMGSDVHAATPPPSGAELAVDPTLSVLAIYRRATAALECTNASLQGVLAVYGMHPTGVPNTNELYHGDIFGFAVRAAEGELASTPAPAADSEPVAPSVDAERQRESAPPNGKPVIVGLANGVEGDVSPKILSQSVFEARAHGRALGRAIARVTRDVSDLAATGNLTHFSWDLYFPSGQYDEQIEHKLCPNAELGMASAGGARDGPTRLRVIPAANAGFQPNRPSLCHDQKLPLRAGSSSQYAFPTTGPIGLVEIVGKDGGAPFVIATVPGEVSTATGERISNVIKAHLPTRSGVAIVGLTNQYFQYFATREEYPFQYYEGASTLYGPNSAQFLVRYFGCLSARLDGKKASCRGPYRINAPAPLNMIPPVEVSRWPDDEHPDLLSLGALVARRVPREGAVGWEMNIRALPLLFTSEPSDFSVQVLANDAMQTVLDDDRGASIEVRETDEQTWRIRWIPDLRPGDARCNEHQSFRLAVRGRVSLTSQAFRLDCPPLEASPPPFEARPRRLEAGPPPLEASP